MRFSPYLSAALLVLLPLSASAASVSTMTREVTVQSPDGSSYAESSVSCRGTTEPRVIWRQESSREWCAKEVEGICSTQKIKVAKKVCSRSYEQLLEAAQTTDDAVAPAQ